VREESLAFDQVAILLRSAERYQPMVEDALRRAGVPAYFSHGSARPDPGGGRFWRCWPARRSDFPRRDSPNIFPWGSFRQKRRQRKGAARGRNATER